MQNKAQAPIRGQGAIEYLLIIGAAILVVAIVTAAVMTIIQQGQTQNTNATTNQIKALDKMQQIKLIAEDKLSLGYTINPATGILPDPITRADGTRITTQQQLDAAYAAGEIIIYQNGRELSIAQKPGSQKYTLNITGCYGGSRSVGYGADMLTYSNPEAQSTFGGKTGKITSVNNNPTYSNLIGKTYEMITGTPVSNCCAACGGNKCIRLDPASFVMTSAQCPYSSWTSPGTTTQGWQVEVYDYNLVLGSTPGTGDITIDPITGTITGIGFTTTQTLTCSETQTVGTPPFTTTYTKKCFTYATGCDMYPYNCTVDLDNNCSNFTCDDSTCYVRYLGTSPNYRRSCLNKTINIPNVTVDYYHEPT
jgi:hypothetical protein